MEHEDILLSAFNKLYVAAGRPKHETLSANAKTDASWLIGCAELNAEYGYGCKTLKKLNATGRYYAQEYGQLGAEFCDHIGRIGWARCAEDKAYEEEKWNELKAWAETPAQ